MPDPAVVDVRPLWPSQQATMLACTARELAKRAGSTTDQMKAILRRMVRNGAATRLWAVRCPETGVVLGRYKSVDATTVRIPCATCGSHSPISVKFEVHYSMIPEAFVS